MTDDQFAELIEKGYVFEMNDGVIYAGYVVDIHADSVGDYARVKAFDSDGELRNDFVTIYAKFVRRFVLAKPDRGDHIAEILAFIDETQKKVYETTSTGAYSTGYLDDDFDAIRAKVQLKDDLRAHWPSEHIW
jgi:hypothetical protein